MRQETGFLQHQRRHRREIRQCRLVPELGELVAGSAIAQFRLVAEGEQRLLAAGLGTGAGDLQYLLGGEEGRYAAAWWMREGAVVAHIAAQLGQRYEDLARIGDEIAVRR